MPLSACGETECKSKKIVRMWVGLCMDYCFPEGILLRSRSLLCLLRVTEGATTVKEAGAVWVHCAV